MRFFSHVTMAFIATLALAAAPARARTCQAENLTCPTTMPVDGYCECTSHGVTKDGTVVEKPARRDTPNAAAGGCGAHPDASGCH